MKRALFATFLVVVFLMASLAGCGKSGTAPQTPPGGGNGPKVESTGAGEAAPTGDSASQYIADANPAPVTRGAIVDGGTIVTRYGAEPDTLNPLTGRDAYSSAILGYVMDSLTGRNLDTLEWEPRLAESWETSQDKLSYTFHLRKDVKWDDGAPFTADDVVFTFEKIMDEKVDAPQSRLYYIDLESITAPDPYTVVFKWKKPYFLSFNFSAGFQPLPKHVFERGDFNTNPAGRAPIGNGRYRFVRWETNQEIVLERNEDYYGRKPHITKMVIRFIPDQNAALLQASSGVVDTMEVTAEQWVKELGQEVFKENFNKYYYYDPNYRFMGWNNKRPWFTDKRVRRAMTHIVNRELFLDRILFGMGKIVTGTFYINGPDYSADIKPWPYDLNEARRLLDEAGWVDSDKDGIRDKVVDGQRLPFAFNFMIPGGNPVSEQLATLFQEEAKKVGIAVNIQMREWAIFGEKLNESDFDAVSLGWSLGLEQDPYQLWHSSQAGQRGSNFIGYANAEVDKIIEDARVEFDADKRRALYHRFNEILHEEQPYTFLFCQPSREILNKRIHNVRVHKLGLDSRDWYIPAELQK